jgi:imidazolonepropionase-like amidohydrolase
VTDRGTIAVGKRADLLVLYADPLSDIHNTRKIFAVYHDGRSVADLPGR